MDRVKKSLSRAQTPSGRDSPDSNDFDSSTSFESYYSLIGIETLLQSRPDPCQIVRSSQISFIHSLSISDCVGIIL